MDHRMSFSSSTTKMLVRGMALPTSIRQTIARRPRSIISNSQLQPPKLQCVSFLLALESLGFSKAECDGAFKKRRYSAAILTSFAPKPKTFE